MLYNIKGGHGGKEWVDKHIEAFIPIGGPLLGATKSFQHIYLEKIHKV